jgi:outer membrane protein assembly factor BamB
MKKIRHCLMVVMLGALSCGCDKDKEPLVGKREEIFLPPSSDFSYSHQALSMGSAQVISPSWPLNWFNTSNNVGNLSVPGMISDVIKQLNAGLSYPYALHELRSLTPHPIIADGLLFRLDEDGDVSAYHLDSGERLWSRSIMLDDKSGYTRSGGGCAYQEGKLFVTSPYGHVLCMQARSGKKLWERSVGSPLRGAPMVYKGSVFALTANNQLHALRASDGEVLWVHFGIPEPVQFCGAALPAVTDKSVVVGYSSGEVYALDFKTGEEQWRYSSMSPGTWGTLPDKIVHVLASPVIQGQYVYVLSANGPLTAFDMVRGEPLWSKSIASVETPVVSGNALFVLGKDQTLYAIDRSQGLLFWSLPLNKLKHSSHQEKEDSASEESRLWYGPFLLNGQIYVVSGHGDLWRVSSQGKGTFVLNLGVLPVRRPFVAGGKLYILTAEGVLQSYAIPRTAPVPPSRHRHG